MTLPRPFHSIALLFRDAAVGRPVFLGTCFSYRREDRFVGAAHCVGNLAASQLRIVLPLSDHSDFLTVTSVTRHPEADVCVLEASEVPSGATTPFMGPSSLSSWGERVQALGYPEESTPSGVLPTARLFTGHIQRLMTYRSFRGYEYFAGELSFGAPGGLSGGPVFPTAELGLLVGIVVENIDSTTYLRSVEEVQEDGKSFSAKLHEVIRYGIFVHVQEIAEWLRIATA